MSEIIQLHDGDGVSWVGQSDFRFQCCDCGLLHRFEVEVYEEGRGTIKFYREDDEEE